jgi:hypothetical protein
VAGKRSNRSQASGCRCVFKGEPGVICVWALLGGQELHTVEIW